MNEIIEVRQQCRLNQWNAMIQTRIESGLSVRAFCKQNNISEKTYYYRLRKIREYALEVQTEPEFVEIKATKPEPQQIIIRNDTTTVEIPIIASPEVVAAAVSFLR